MPSAITRPWSMTAMRSASRSASSRYWVVSSTVVPSATSSSIVSHRSTRLRGSRPGGRLVEEQHRRARDERGREVEPAAHAAGVGLRHAVGGVGEVEALEQLAPARLGGARGARRRGGRPSRGSRAPVRWSSTAAYWPARPMRARSFAASRTTSSPATRAVPASGESRVERIRTVVVLPAPLGPSTPSTVPGAASRSTPSSARTSPNDLTRPRDLDRWGENASREPSQPFRSASVLNLRQSSSA